MRYNPVPPLVVGGLIGIGLALLNACTVGPAQTLDTHTGEWEEAAPYCCEGAHCIPSLDPEPDPRCSQPEPLYDEPIGPPTPPETTWQCDGQPCTDEQLQQLLDALEALEGTERE